MRSLNQTQCTCCGLWRLNEDFKRLRGRTYQPCLVCRRRGVEAWRPREAPVPPTVVFSDRRKAASKNHCRQPNINETQQQ